MEKRNLIGKLGRFQKGYYKLNIKKNVKLNHVLNSHQKLRLVNVKITITLDFVGG
jgi:hypothetical protein